MSWKKPVCTLGAVLLCTSVLLASDKGKPQVADATGLQSPIVVGQQLMDRTLAATAQPAVPDQGPRVGGDTCDVATVIGALPYNDTGNTCGFTNDYDEVCPYTGSTSPDVAYEFTPAADIYVDIDLCNGSAYDTKLYVYEGGCPGTLVACNDDACPGYVSQILGLSLTGGVTYYIIVDGYGTDCGDYVLDVIEGTPPPPPPDCPEGSLFSQPVHLPEDGWSAGTSEADVQGSVYNRYENFSGVTGPICDIHWWGLQLVLDGGWAPCVDSDPSFEIKFYQDAGGMPGPEVCSYVVAANVIPTGLLYADTYELNYYSVDLLSPCCTISDGWVSIQGLGDVDCWFLWMSARVGDAHSWFENNGVFEDYYYDNSVCLTGEYVPTFGACCDDSTGVCTENVELIDCMGPNMRFLEDGTCDQFDPPCGQIPGACCYPDGTCEEVLEAECLEPGMWLGPWTTCDMCPCMVICPAEGTPEGEVCGEDTNGGCNMDVPAFEPIACGQTICGTIWADGGTRDTDWFEVTVEESTIFTFTVEAEFDLLGVVCGLIEPVIPGVVGCEGEITGSLNPYTTGGECEVISVTTECLPPGTYWFFVSALDYYNLPCGGNNDYVATLECAPCTVPTGACCFPDGSCGDDMTAAECMGQGGIYQGDDTDCASVECPVLAEADFCEDAVLVDVPSRSLGSNMNATVDAGFFPCDTDITSPGVWFKVIGTGNTMTATTCTDDGFYEIDTKLTVFCGGCSTAEWACIAGNDDGCDSPPGGSSLLSTVTWCSAAGEEYSILVHSYGGATGLFELDVFDDGVACDNPPPCEPPFGACCVGTDCIGDMSEVDCSAQGGTLYVGESCDTFECPEPPPDDCENAMAIGEVLDLPFDTSTATFDGPGGCMTSPNIWYCFTAPCTGTMYVGLCDSEYDTKLAVYDGCECWGEMLDCNDDSCGLQSEIWLEVTAGQQILIEVGGYGSNAGPGVLDVQMDCVAPWCDLDGDLDVDVDDYYAFLDAFGTCVGDPKYIAEADTDGDECITLVDYQAFIQCYRDANPGKLMPRVMIPKVQGTPTPSGNSSPAGPVLLP